jgi:hypothetical protein
VKKYMNSPSFFSHLSMPTSLANEKHQPYIVPMWFPSPGAASTHGSQIVKIEDYMFKCRIFSTIPKYSLFSFTKLCSLKKYFFENFNIYTNNIISVKAAQVLNIVNLAITILKKILWTFINSFCIVNLMSINISKGPFRQGSKDQKPKDQFEANWILIEPFFTFKKTFFS